MSGRRGAARESGWISCGTGTCGSSSAASRSCPSAIPRSRPAGNWRLRAPAPAERHRGACRLTRLLWGLRRRPPGAARGLSPRAARRSPSRPRATAGGLGQRQGEGVGTSSFRLSLFPTVFPVNSELPFYSLCEAANHLASPTSECSRRKTSHFVFAV